MIKYTQKYFNTIWIIMSIVFYTLPFPISILSEATVYVSVNKHTWLSVAALHIIVHTVL